MASTSPSDPQNEALKLLKKEKAAMDRQIADLQARSREYGKVIEGLEAPAPQPAPVLTPAEETALMAVRVSQVFAAAVKDSVPVAALPRKETVLFDMVQHKHQ